MIQMKGHKRRIVAALAVPPPPLGLTAGSAVAANVHFKNPHGHIHRQQADPDRHSGCSLASATGDIVMTLTATSTPSATCTNQGGDEGPAEVTLTGVDFIPSSEVKNGTVGLSVATGAPDWPTAAEAGCPNDNWTAEITDVDFSSATITVYQPCLDTEPPISCPIVLTRTFSV